MYLTTAGSGFLNSASSFLQTYNTAVSECRKIQNETLSEIVVQQAPYVDLASARYDAILHHIAKNKPHLSIREVRHTQEGTPALLRSKRADLVLHYRCSTVESALADYTERNIVAKYLATDKIVIFCRKGHPLGHVRPLSPRDVRDFPIMAPQGIVSSMKTAIGEFCRYNGFSPSVVKVAAKTPAEFLDAHLPSSIYLYPKTFATSPILRTKTNMQVLEFDRGQTEVHSFALVLNDPKEACLEIADTFKNMESFCDELENV